MGKITPFLWFDNNAEEAVNLYITLFENSKITALTRYSAEAAAVSGQKEGSVMTIAFELDGQKFTAINGGPHFKFTEAVSFAVNCKSQEEVDKYWDKLTSGGGTESQCGWLKDKFGLSWQIIPEAMIEMMRDKDTAKSKRVVEAMLKMKKLDVAVLTEAFNGQK